MVYFQIIKEFRLINPIKKGTTLSGVRKNKVQLSRLNYN